MQNVVILKTLRDFAAGVYLSEAQNPIRHPLHNVYVCTVYLFKQGGE